MLPRSNWYCGHDSPPRLSADSSPELSGVSPDGSSAPSSPLGPSSVLGPSPSLEPSGQPASATAAPALPASSRNTRLSSLRSTMPSRLSVFDLKSRATYVASPGARGQGLRRGHRDRHTTSRPNTLYLPPGSSMLTPHRPPRRDRRRRGRRPGLTPGIVRPGEGTGSGAVRDDTRRPAAGVGRAVRPTPSRRRRTRVVLPEHLADEVGRDGPWRLALRPQRGTPTTEVVAPASKEGEHGCPRRGSVSEASFEHSDRINIYSYISMFPIVC